jgi:type 1 fimbria pilin
MAVLCSRSSVLFVAVTVCVALGLAGCGGDAQRTDAEVVNPRLVQTPGGQRVFAGTLVNQGSSAIPIAEIEIALYDDRGSRIETMRIQVQDVAPSDSSDFSQPINTDKAIQQAQVQGVLIP